MALHEVTLFSEQRVLLRVEAPEDATDRDLYRLTLESLDAGEASWDSVFAGFLRGVPGEKEQFWDQVRGLRTPDEMRGRS